MHGGKGRRILAAALLGVVAGALGYAMPASAATVTCTFTPTRGVRVTMTGFGAVATIKLSGDLITVNDLTCGEGRVIADRFNTERVIVRADDANDQHAWIDETAGMFSPGATDEAGSSDEIEFGIDLGGGWGSAYIRATAMPDAIRLGTPAAGTSLVNLNAAEADGLDYDVVATHVSALSVHGGAGADVIRATGGAATGSPLTIDTTFLYGGDGPDTMAMGPAGGYLYGEGHDDTLDGGDGNDVLVGGPGNDTERGGAGADGFDEGPVANGADTFEGGPGSDSVHYSFRTSSVRVTYDGVANDGSAAGEGDLVKADVEAAFGSTVADVLVGNGWANRLAGNEGNDQINGGGGADRLSGGDGADLIVGGAGRDDIFGGAGADRIEARDGVRDEIDAGTGSDSCAYDFWIDSVTSC